MIIDRQARRRWRPAVRGVALAGTIAAGIAVAVPIAAQPAAAACAATTASGSAAASQLARRCGTRVAVSDATTPTSTLTANGDGSFTTTESVVPERIRRADGTWVAVDTTLRANGDGSISPVASPTAVVLSGGGTGPLARTASGGQELTYTWTGFTLPRPTLAGSVATYPSVLPDVDLDVTVDEWGFGEVLVVKTAAAAANPRLAQLRFALGGSGLSAAGAAGQATTPDAAVTGNFEIGDAHMWDSTQPAVAPTASMPVEDVQSETVSTYDGPGSGAKVATMTPAMDGTTLVVTPAKTLLTDPAVKFPVFIDPKQTSPARSYWAMINSGRPGQEYWDYDRADHAKVGNAGTNVDMYRSMFQFATTNWKNKHVTAATFSDDLVHSWSCSNTTTELHLVSQTLSVHTTWTSNASAWGGSLATVSNHNCVDAKNVHSEFSSASLTSTINSARANATVTLGLRAASETVSGDGSNGWKKFDETSAASGAHLSVTYNTAPVLSSLHVDAATCGTSASNAPTLSTVGSPPHNPVPQVTVTDGESDKSTVTFTYPKAGGGTTSTAYPNVASAGSQKLVNGIPAAGLPATTPTTYSWSVTASDGTDSSSATCYFKIDNTLPQMPTITASDGVYPDDNGYHGGVGKPGSFTIAATGDAATVAAVVKYMWGPSTGPLQTATTTAGAPVTVSYTPPAEGDNTLQAYAYTSAGVVSAMGSADFLANGPDQPAGDWLLNGDGTDSGTGAHPATATDVTWTAGGRQLGQSVAHLNGTSSALTATPAIRTDTSFAVSAWVRPSGTSCTATAVDQDGVHTSGLYLGCYQGKFTFDVIPSDSASVTTVRTVSSATAPIGLWSNIVGVYDLSNKKISLYVNGVFQSSATLTGTLWNATGPLAIGRSRYNDLYSYWPGDLSDVRVWDRMIYPSDIAMLAASSWADQYPLGGADLTRDSQDGGANPLTISGSPQPTIDDMNPPGTGGTPAVLLNPATSDRATSLRSAVRTDGSFSVSAWVDPVVLPGNAYVNAVSQNSAVTSNFGLGINSTNHFDFWMHGVDAASTPAYVAASSASVVAGQWVHLIGTFDAGTRTLSIYLNGTLAGTAAFGGTPWAATGPVAIGYGQWQSAPGYLWNGGVDNVGLFNGVLNATEIDHLYNFNNPYYNPDDDGS